MSPEAPTTAPRGVNPVHTFSSREGLDRRSRDRDRWRGGSGDHSNGRKAVTGPPGAHRDGHPSTPDDHKWGMTCGNEDQGTRTHVGDRVPLKHGATRPEDS
jgi:hypothetical protein